MRAVNAVRVKAKARQFSQSRSTKKAQKGKVIVLPLHRLRKPKGLTDGQRQDIVVENRTKANKMARSILRKWHSRLDLEELQSVVDLSLCEAVKNYNPARGASFITFLFYHLRGNLIRAVTQAASANGMPLNEYEEIDPNHDLENLHSFNSTEITEALSDNEMSLPDEVLYRKEIANLSQKACERLDDLERQVIKRVLLGEEQLMNVAENLGYSRCHISRVKKKALGTLFSELKGACGEERNFNLIMTAMEEESAPRRRKMTRRHAQHRRPMLEMAEPAEESQYLEAMAG